LGIFLRLFPWQASVFVLVEPQFIRGPPHAFKVPDRAMGDQPIALEDNSLGP
jgi:hypothetical protein